MYFLRIAAYKHVKGQKLDDAHLADIYEGLRLNDINHYSHILTGKFPNDLSLGSMTKWFDSWDVSELSSFWAKHKYWIFPILRIISVFQEDRKKEVRVILNLLRGTNA